MGKKYYKHYDFLPRYHRMTNRMVAYVLAELPNAVPVTFVAQKAGISPTTATGIFDHVHYSKPYSLPKVLAIDEFKGNAAVL